MRVWSEYHALLHAILREISLTLSHAEFIVFRNFREMSLDLTFLPPRGLKKYNPQNDKT